MNILYFCFCGQTHAMNSKAVIIVLTVYPKENRPLLQSMNSMYTDWLKKTGLREDETRAAVHGFLV